MASVASEICPVRGVRLSCGRHAVQFKMLPQTTRRRQLQARVRQRIPIGARPENPQLLPVPSSDSAREGRRGGAGA